MKFVRDGNDVAGGFDVYVSMGSRDGSSSPVQKRTKELRFPAADLNDYLTQSLTYAMEIAVEPGRTQVSVGVLDQRSEKTGFGRIEI
jgi:hypothetical protein